MWSNLDLAGMSVWCCIAHSSVGSHGTWRLCFRVDTSDLAACRPGTLMRDDDGLLCLPVCNEAARPSHEVRHERCTNHKTSPRFCCFVLPTHETFLFISTRIDRARYNICEKAVSVSHLWRGET
jgi:hypothetical protein